MSDGQEYDYKNLQCKELLSKVNCQAFITKQYANKSYNDLYVNAGPDIPDVDGLKNDSLEFLFTKTREHYGFPDKRPFDPSVVENVSVSDFLMVFDDCLSRFESAFQNLNDSSSEAAGYLKVTRTEIRDYLRCLGTSVEPDAFNIDLYIPKNDKGTVWRMKALVHRDFAMTAEYFSQAMNHFHGECDKI